MTIGNLVCELRKEKGLSQKKLADAIGVSQAAIAKIEINRNEATSDTIRKLAKYFDVSADYLLGLTSDDGAELYSPPTAGTMHEGATLTEKEKALLKAFKNLLPETQDFILRTAQNFATDGEKSLKKS